MDRKDLKGRILRKGEGQLKNGRYYFQYYDLSKNRRKIYANSIKELREKEDEIAFYNIKGIDLYAGRKLTLNEYFDKYMKTKVNLRQTSKANYVYMYNKYIRESMGKYAIGTIKYSILKAFIIGLITDKALKINTVSLLYTIIYPVFTMAVRDGIITNNPASSLMSDIKKGMTWEKIKKRALTKVEQKNFIQYVSNSPKFYRWLPLFVLFLGTGLRLGEAFSLTDNDVDFENKLIKVQHTLIYTVNEKGTLQQDINFPKTKSSIRIIPIIDDVYNALKTEIAYRDSRKLKSPILNGLSGFIFLNRKGHVHNPRSVNAVIERIIKYYNEEEKDQAKLQNRKPEFLPHFSIHNFRHTFCTRFCEVENNVKVIQDIMGHSNITTTMNIYAEATMEEKEKVVQKLNNINFISIE